MSYMQGGKRIVPVKGGAQRKRTRRVQTYRQFSIPTISRRGGIYGRYSNGGELKFHDIDVDDAVVAAGANVSGETAPTATPGTLVSIAQGVTESTRVGRKCTIKSILFRYDIGLNAVNQGTGIPDVIRVILYVDKQANGLTITNTDLLETADYQSFNNLGNSGRFKVLMDRTHDLQMTAGGWDGTGVDFPATVASYSLYKKCNIPLEFSGATGALTELRSNNINLMVCAKNGTAFFNSKMRFRFSDS